VWGGVVAGVALRAWVLASPLGRPDEDEAVVGLMAQRLLDHGGFRTFFWGQHYGGSQESVLAAALFLVAGSSTLVLKLVPVALHAVAAWLTWRIGRRTVGEPAALVGGVLVWVYPGIYVWWSTKARGFYGVTLVVGLLVVLAALRLAERPDVRDGVLLGGSAGLGLWASPQIAYFLVPSLLWLGWTRRRCWRELARPGAFALGALVIGALPWLAYNAQRAFAALELMTGGAEVGGGSLGDFVDVLRVALGLAAPSSRGWPLPVLTVTAAVVLAVGFVRLLIRRPPGTGILLLFVALYPILWSRQQFLLAEAALQPRYLYYLLPAVLLLVAYALRTWRRQVVAVVVLVALSAVGMTWVMDQPERTEDRPADSEAVLAVLREEKVDRLYAHGACYSLSFLTEERVICVPVFGSRERSYEDQVRTGRHPAFLFPRGSQLERDLISELARLHIGHRRVDVAGFGLFLTDERVVPRALGRNPFFFQLRLAKPCCRGARALPTEVRIRPAGSR
jgi:hypothetical protein